MQSSTTEGRTSETITGTNFGADPSKIQITLDNHAYSFQCTPETAAHESLVCNLPPGTGANYNVTIIVDGQSDIGAPLFFSYDTPTIRT
jgi:hypothetical protein